VKIGRLRRPKAAYSPSSADFRPKTNAAILWDRGHTKGMLCNRGIGQGKETRSLNEVDVLLYRNEYRNFQMARATMGSRLKRNKEDWKRRVSWSCTTYMHGSNTRKLPV
jgi:hypothetical protein